MAFKQRIQSFYDLIYEERLEVVSALDISRLRKICFESGCPDDDKHIRSIVWKILLGYLPINRNEWNNCLQQKRQLYQEFIRDLIIENSSIGQSQDDHPLNTDPNSHWKNYFRENEILQQIDKDVRRLYPDISFFQQKIARKFDSSDSDILSGRMNNSAHSIDVIKDCFGMTEIRKNKVYDQNQYIDPMAADSNDGEFHWQVVARILFIYAKLNPGQGYVQGMNEIIGPIYYVFSNDSKLEWRTHSEADTFWCFTSLMSEIRDIFNKHADSDRSSGIVSRMDRLVQILSKEDLELCQRINLIQGIKPHYYAFRWITLLLSQEFPLPDVLRLWDFMFSDENRFDFLLKLCCSMIIILRDQLMSGDFANNMKLLQNFPDSIEITFIVARAKTIQTS
ncbi:TBC1 domain family member 13 [Dermatophagoides pteronyssinus]|uniref:TBC1 domain family member 13 n=2 Tax=Dermatophagoides pteronyssinus TaxID=6956 RepID=A0A6P6XLP7_DERPT|nr:TBC1 domain family member 13-like [Dermatophagoides pteronyssinus]KAH9415688.1 hypothetical protein DERP_000178 [Dermatophagoides pteronyssinus]